MSKSTVSKAQEKRDRIRNFSKEISQYTNEELQEIAEELCITTIEGHVLSLKNQVLLDTQTRDLSWTPSVVGGYKQWLEAGRQVKKGSSSLAIIAGAMGNKKDKEGNNIINKDSGENEKKLQFRIVNVFDITQTEEIQE